MTDLHPHWHSTSDDDASGASAAAQSRSSTGPVRVSITPASRLPAAVVGIFAFAVIGFSVAGGWESLSSFGAFTAQVGGSSSTAPAASAALPVVEIRITPTGGFQPQAPIVRPGQTVAWINEQSIPHILTSQTLRNASGNYLNTPAIFPGTGVSFTVGPQEPDREHFVMSTTDQALVGSVIVSSSGQAVSTSSASGNAPFGGTAGVNLPSGQGTTSSKSSTTKVSKFRQSSSPSVAPVIINPPPVESPPVTPTPVPVDSNPFSGPPQTFDMYGLPQNQYQEPLPSQDSYAPLSPEPLEQPHTGPGLWAVCLMSMGVLWGMTRKYFMKPEMLRR